MYRIQFEERSSQGPVFFSGVGTTVLDFHFFYVPTYPISIDTTPETNVPSYPFLNAPTYPNRIDTRPEMNVPSYPPKKRPMYLRTRKKRTRQGENRCPHNRCVRITAKTRWQSTRTRFLRGAQVHRVLKKGRLSGG